jgi:hypothetical protein
MKSSRKALHEFMGLESKRNSSKRFSLQYPYPVCFPHLFETESRARSLATLLVADFSQCMVYIAIRLVNYRCQIRWIKLNGKCGAICAYLGALIWQRVVVSSFHIIFRGWWRSSPKNRP